jgi:hypothetical protein
MTLTCIFCADTGWVCENHVRLPWERPHAYNCSGAGMPYSACNVPEEDAVRRLPEGGWGGDVDVKVKRVFGFFAEKVITLVTKVDLVAVFEQQPNMKPRRLGPRSTSSNPT